MKKRILSLMMSVAFIVGVQSTVWADTENYSDGDVHTIGVVVYDPDSAEMEMFADCYRDYIQEGFPVKFIFSGKVADSESEKAFIEEAKAEGNWATVMSAFHVSAYLDKISDKEKEQDSNIMVGAIDSFPSRTLRSLKKKILLETHRSTMFAVNTLPWQVRHSQ